MALNVVCLGLLMSLVTGSFGGTDPWCSFGVPLVFLDVL